MKIRLFRIFAVITLMFSDLTFGQSDYVKKLPLVNFELECVSDNGLPVEGVDVKASDYMLNLKEEFRRDTGKSGRDGKCLLQFRALSTIGVFAQKEGYYPSTAPARHEYPIDERFQFDPFIREGVDSRDREVELPMKERVDLRASITMRKIRNPTALYAKRVRMDIPVRDAWLGYDFEVGDWVEPHGKGVNSDMRIRSVPKIIDPETNELKADGVATLEIDFGEHGGLVRVNEENGWFSVSEMKMPHLSPQSGYEQLPALRIEQTSFEDSSENGKANGYFFRTRVKREDGRIVSAHYGKLWGRINYVPVQREEAWWGDEKKNLPTFGSVEFTYYFNPSPNDRNLEFDPKQNLLKQLNPEQLVKQP